MRHFGAILVIALGCSRGEPESAAPAAAIPTAPASVAKAPEPASPLHVRGAIELPTGALEFLAVIDRSEPGSASGTLSIPAQGLKDADLSAVNITADELEFSLGQVGATWRMSLTSSTPRCTFEQRGMQLPCTAELSSAPAVADAAAPERPQTPTPPFPYDVEALEYDNPSADVHLAGTLTLPPGAGPHPVALLISGSGAQDRDETLAGHKPFWVLSDHLARRGIATLRVDDRGVGGTSAGPPGATSQDFATDVEAGISVLRAHPRVDPKRIGLIGHSEGGLIASMVASRDRRIAFVVLMAAPGVPGAELIPEQAAAIVRAQGATAEVAAAAKDSSRRTMALLRADTDDEALRRHLAEELGMAADAPELRVRLEMATSPWFRAFVRTDPRPFLRKVRAPVLALNGTLDTQVLADQNLPEIERALRKGGNRRVRIERLEGRNHLLQPAETGSPTEYSAIETTLDPAVLELVATFIATSR